MECVGEHKLGRGVCLDLGIVMGLGGKRYEIFEILFGLHFAYFGGWINGYHGWATNLWEDGSEDPGFKLYGWREPGWNMDGSGWIQDQLGGIGVCLHCFNQLNA
jgi:hypothetical protein